MRRHIRLIADRLPVKSRCSKRSRSKIATGLAPSSCISFTSAAHRSTLDSCCGARRAGRCFSSTACSTATSGRSFGSPTSRPSASNTLRYSRSVFGLICSIRATARNLSPSAPGGQTPVMCACRGVPSWAPRRHASPAHASSRRMAWVGVTSWRRPLQMLRRPLPADRRLTRPHGSVSAERTVTPTPGASIVCGTINPCDRMHVPTPGASRLSPTLSDSIVPSAL